MALYGLLCPAVLILAVIFFTIWRRRGKKIA